MVNTRMSFALNASLQCIYFVDTVCDIGQIDIFSRIELYLHCVLSSRVTNYKNDIQ